MYEYSRDYLNKLIAQSGVKMGTAKQGAMVAIIELLDENILDGLIKSIRADYNSMKDELRWMTYNIQEAKRSEIQKRGEVNALKEEVNALNLEIERLEEEKGKKRLEALCEGILPEERSRLLAFDAAIRLLDDRYGRRGVDAEQIIRSASNVAANWRHEPEKACGKGINHEDHH